VYFDVYEASASTDRHLYCLELDIDLRVESIEHLDGLPLRYRSSLSSPHVEVDGGKIIRLGTPLTIVNTKGQVRRNNQTFRALQSMNPFKSTPSQHIQRRLRSPPPNQLPIPRQNEPLVLGMRVVGERDENQTHRLFFEPPSGPAMPVTANPKSVLAR